MDDPLLEILKNHDHRLQVQQMISTLVLGLLTDELERSAPGLRNHFHQVLDSAQASAADNQVVTDAIAAIRTTLG